MAWQDAFRYILGGFVALAFLITIGMLIRIIVSQFIDNDDDK